VRMAKAMTVCYHLVVLSMSHISTLCNRYNYLVFVSLITNVTLKLLISCTNQSIHSIKFARNVYGVPVSLLAFVMLVFTLIDTD